MCERNLFRSYIIEFEGKGEKEEKQIKFFATLYVGTEEAIDIIIVSLFMYITHKNTCVYTRHTFTYPRKYMLLSICMRLESFYKYYKGTVIRVHDVYRRVSKEGLITQAPFLRLSSMRKTKECARKGENVKECECVCVYACVRACVHACKKVRERESIESQHSTFLDTRISIINYIPNFVLSCFVDPRHIFHF